MTKGQFHAASGLSVVMTERWYSVVEAAMFERAIVSPRRAAMFIAQVGHESMGFVCTAEIWGPTAAQRGYEGRKDLGNTQPGDGSRFRGRGLIQITGRANYQAVSDALGVDFVATPSLLQQDGYAARSAAWWWATHGCNELTDTGSVEAVTRRINGGLNGLADRQRRYSIALEALS